MDGVPRRDALKSDQARATTNAYIGLCERKLSFVLLRLENVNVLL
jgi:hypothetical protein